MKKVMSIIKNMNITKILCKRNLRQKTKFNSFLNLWEGRSSTFPK